MAKTIVVNEKGVDKVLKRNSRMRTLCLFFVLEKIDSSDLVKMFKTTSSLASEMLTDLEGLSFIENKTSDKKTGQGNTKGYYSLFEINRVIIQDKVNHLFKSDEFIADKKLAKELLKKGELSGVKK